MTINISDNAEKKTKMKNTKKNKRIRQFHRPPTILLNRYAPVIDITYVEIFFYFVIRSISGHIFSTISVILPVWFERINYPWNDLKHLIIYTCILYIKGDRSPMNILLYFYCYFRSRDMKKKIVHQKIEIWFLSAFGSMKPINENMVCASNDRSIEWPEKFYILGLEYWGCNLLYKFSWFHYLYYLLEKNKWWGTEKAVQVRNIIQFEPIH